MLLFSGRLMTYRSSILYVAAAIAFCLSGYAQTPIGELSATDASIRGAVVMNAGDTGVASGSMITAGETTAFLRLARGGEVRICPHSSLSITASQNGNQLMLAISSGAIEVHYRLGNSADTILTPDFRVLAAGPGEFHSAIASDTRGNTCIRALQPNAASLIVNELLGDGAYQVRPGGEAFFHDGTVKNADSVAPPDCACPLPPIREEKPPLPKPEGEASTPAPRSSVEPATSTPASPPPAVPAGDVHVSVDAPFVFRANDAVPPPLVARLSLQTLPPLLGAPPPVEPPPPARVEPSAAKGSKPTPKKGFFGHLGSWFGSIFHSGKRQPAQ